MRLAALALLLSALAFVTACGGSRNYEQTEENSSDQITKTSNEASNEWTDDRSFYEESIMDNHHFAPATEALKQEASNVIDLLVQPVGATVFESDFKLTAFFLWTDDPIEWSTEYCEGAGEYARIVGTEDETSIWLGHTRDNKFIEFGMQGVGGTGFVLQSDSSPSTEVVTKVEVRRNGTTVELLIDGVVEDSATIDLGAVFFGNTLFGVIGSIDGLNDGLFQGDIYTISLELLNHHENY